MAAPCPLCPGYLPHSVRELQLHLIGHGPVAIARLTGRPDLARRGSWGRVLRRSVVSLARRGAVART